MQNITTYDKVRKRVFTIIEIGKTGDYPSQAYDMFYAVAILVNLAVSIMYTFDEMELAYGPLLLNIEAVTIAFFAFDYCLRIWTAKYLYPDLKQLAAIRRYACSFTGIIDILSFLPYYLPIFFPTGAVAFRMLRIVRIFRLFRINAYYDSLHIISEVISSKKQQLVSSVFIIVVLMLSSSLCMYSLEHEAQPEVFANAFSGIWWSVSTLLTIGYGDIYPITTLGKIFSIIITFLGVGMVAIPTGIISAGFVDQYSRIKRISEYALEQSIHFIKIRLTTRDRWAHMAIMDIGLPEGVIVAVIQRRDDVIVPRGDVVLQPDDVVVLAAESYGKEKHIELKEIVLGEFHPWNGQYIRELDISRQTIIVMVERQHRHIIPRGGLMLQEGDKVMLYTQSRMADANIIEI